MNQNLLPLAIDTQASPPIPIPLPQGYVNERREKYIGSKIRQAVYITGLFVIFMHSFNTLDKIYFMITQKQFEFVTEENQEPTLKGYIVSCLIVFSLTLWIICV